MGSLDVVTDIKAVAEACEKAVWMDCYDQGMPGYEYSFLNDSDISLLNKAGMMIPLYDNQLQQEAVARHLAYANIKKELVILTPEKVECRKSYPQQVPHLDSAIEDKTSWTPEGMSTPVVEANTQKMAHEVDSKIFTGLDKIKKEGGIRRNKESFSSLNVLIQNPFDYALQYIFGCGETTRGNLSTVKGNVVHKMFNNAVIAAKNDWNGIKKFLVDDFDANFEKSVNEVGIELMSIENRLTYNLFKNIVRETSIPVFIEFVEENNLKVVGSEVDIIVELKEIGTFEAKIDMVLKNASDEYVIMDLKWTDSKAKKRQEEIKNNEEMQLALYAEAVNRYYGSGETSCVAAIGYFMLRQGVFITASDGFKKSSHVKVMKKESTDSIFEMVKKSYKFRMAQLIGQDGKSVIEEGEGMKVDDTLNQGYLKEQGRFPLKGVEKKKRGGPGFKGKKETSYGKNVVLKGMLD